jgi:hypothetical protein
MAAAVSFDCAFVGTSPIAIMEAVHQSRQGKRVVMIDLQPDIGGAWRPLTIFGYCDVENAIHYFLFDAKGIAFLRDCLGLRVVRSERKYRILQRAVLGCTKVAYDSRVGKGMIALTATPDGQPRPWGLAGEIGRAMSEARRPSYFMAGGCPDLIACLRALLASTSITLQLRTSVDEIAIDSTQAVVAIRGNRDGAATEVRARRLFLTHGFKPWGRLEVDGTTVAVVEKIHPRPAMHLLIADPAPSRTLEAIFNEDPLIKYANDITRYARKTSAAAPAAEKIVVLALHPHVARTNGLAEHILGRLQYAGMCGPTARVRGDHWTDVVLPTLDDAELDRLRAGGRGCVETMRTENFARGVGLRADDWRTNLCVNKN